MGNNQNRCGLQTKMPRLWPHHNAPTRKSIKNDKIKKWPKGTGQKWPQNLKIIAIFAPSPLAQEGGKEMTPHIEAKKGEIAKTVLMPGDPLRAKYIADNFLENARLVNKVRNIFAYTGTYKGKEITVMASGMGMPSIGIYAYELYTVYEVENIIRIGSCGGYSNELELFDTILAEASYTEGNFAYTFNSEECHLAYATKELNSIIEQTASEQNIKCVKGNILCSECFDLYIPKLQELLDRIPKDLNIIAAEMESFVLFYLAKLLNKKAACLLTVVDIPTKQNQISAEAREVALKDMIKLSLETSLKL